MSWINKNRLLWSALLLLLGQGLEAQEAMSAPRNRDAAVSAAFEQAELTYPQVWAFHRKSEQLITDFVGYYELLRNEDLNADLRTEVISAMTALFSAVTDTVILDQAYQVQELPGLDFTDLPEYTIKQVWLIEPEYHLPAEEVYFPLSVEKTDGIAGRSNALLYRREKSFGDKRLAVWEVKLTRLALGEEN